MRIGVLGAGSWGTTLALMLVKAGHKVKMWEFRPDAARRLEIERENKEFLPGHPFLPELGVSDDISDVVEGIDLCLIAVPSHAMRSTIKRLPDGFPPGCLVVSATKGLEEGTLMRMSQVINNTWGDKLPLDRFTCLSGPSHAEEVVLGLPTSVVAASVNIKAAREVQRLFSSERFRVYAHVDLTGVELGGSLKNVIAIASGIVAGLNFGDNTLGALLTRGLAEISRLGQALGGRASTFAGLSGMGDLITTCCSRHSRNRYVGEQIGKGRTLKDVLAGMVMVAEGVRTTSSACKLAERENVEMPISKQVYRILFEDADPLKATIELMTRKLKIED